MPDDVNDPDPLPMLLETDALGEDEAPLHPLEGRRPLHLFGVLPRADQPVEALEVGAGSGGCPYA